MDHQLNFRLGPSSTRATGVSNLLGAIVLAMLWTAMPNTGLAQAETPEAETRNTEDLDTNALDGTALGVRAQEAAPQDGENLDGETPTPPPAQGSKPPEAVPAESELSQESRSEDSEPANVQVDLSPVEETAKAESTENKSSLRNLIGFDFHGYYRARYTHLSNIPMPRMEREGGRTKPVSGGNHSLRGRDDASDADFFNNRLRLEPTLRLGGDPSKGESPLVALHAQIDLLDNVMWGDNARDANLPLFAGNPSHTNVFGENRGPIFVRRLWLELPVGIGQLRVGRQASQGGLGILFNDGNGFRNDFGDAEGGSTFDRLLFATRPLTIFNAITKNDKSDTPLLLIAGYDRLVNDPLGFGKDPMSATELEARGPFDHLVNPTCGRKFEPDGSTPTEKCNLSVSQWVAGLIWRDDNLNLVKSSDELTLGVIYVNRLQSFSDSSLHIIDGFWKFQLGLGKKGPSLLTEGEAAVVLGQASSINLPGLDFEDEVGVSKKPLRGGIVNVVGRLGLTDRSWDGLVEMGYSTGDDAIYDDGRTFKLYPMHSDYRVGLLMFPVAVYGRTSNTASGMQSDALNSGGGVFNAMYLNPKARYRLYGKSFQAEFIAQGLLGWADALNGGGGIENHYYAPRSYKEPFKDAKCGFMDPDCAIGWEVDAAIKLKWLPIKAPSMGKHDQYALHWSNEFGFMKAGYALAPRLAEGADYLWTVQSRIAFVW